MPRIAILWQRLSGYFNACVSTLAREHEVDVMVVWRAPEVEAPFHFGDVSWGDHDYRYVGRPDVGPLLQRLERFKPDLLVVNSWQVPAYRAALRRFERRSVRVLCMDNQWLGTAKQWLGVCSAPWWVRSFSERVFLPGARQAEFARRLGFQDEQISTGLYSCDHDRFTQVFDDRREAGSLPRDFLFVGRLVEQKGTDVLGQAFRRYKQMLPSGPSLTVCGTGHLATSFDQPGIRNKGFVQPGDLPGILGDHGCLLLPSRFDPWGVAIHEAATAGLSVICSSACGAGDDLVEPDVNGFVVRPGDAEELANCMLRYAQKSPSEVEAASNTSHRLSKQFTPRLWSEKLVEMIRIG